MSDLIDRQAAIDALEKVAELYPWRVPGDRDSYSQYNEAWQDALNRADSEIEALPSVQPEIIMCKDCKHMITHEGYGYLGEPAYTCEGNMEGWVLPDSFCSHAERKDGD